MSTPDTQLFQTLSTYQDVNFFKANSGKYWRLNCSPNSSTQTFAIFLKFPTIFGIHHYFEIWWNKHQFGTQVLPFTWITWHNVRTSCSISNLVCYYFSPNNQNDNITIIKFFVWTCLFQAFFGKKKAILGVGFVSCEIPMISQN